MADWVSVPAGIDVGTTRVRYAAGERNRDGRVRVRAIAARDVPEDVRHGENPEFYAAAIEELLAEVGSRERRCVLGIGAPYASVRHIRFPKMSWPERLRAARFETARWAGFDGDDSKAIVRIHPVCAGDGLYAVGAAAAGSIDRLLALARAARLRVTAIDHESYALRRLFNDVDAIVDVGAERTVVYGYISDSPAATLVETAGNHVTRAIAQDLSIDRGTAEKRKRILGCAGAGSRAQDGMIDGIAAAIARLRIRATIDRIVVTGNGGRLPSFLHDLQEVTGARVEMPVPDLLLEPYPADVVRTAAPDWALAAGLLAWSAAA
jgi:Tfp pilus assembly PilM family ATPase